MGKTLENQNEKEEKPKNHNSVVELKAEKVEQLKKELLVNDRWDIYYDNEEDDYFVKDFWGQSFPIDTYLREVLPNSYFHSPECDEDIIGYDAITGAIVYNLWRVGKKEMLIGESIDSDFHDTGYGIGELLSCGEKKGFGDKIPPIHILLPDFIDYQNRLQGSMNAWGSTINIVKPNISEIEQRRFDMREHIDFYVKFLKDTTDKPEDFRNTYIKILNDLQKEYDTMI